MREGGLDEAARKQREDLRVDLFARNLLLIFFLVVSLGYIMVSQGRVMGIDLTFVLVACVVAIVVIHLGSVARLTLRGDLVRPISDSIYIMAPVLALAIVLYFGPSHFPPYLRGLTVPGLMLGVSLSIGNIVRDQKGPWWIVARALLVLVAGLALRYLSSLVGYPDLGSALMIGMTISASISLLALFQDHGSPLLRYVGGAMSHTGTFLILLAGVTSIAIYVLFLRPIIGGTDGSLVFTLEWLVFSLITVAVSVYLWKGWHKEVRRMEQVIGSIETKVEVLGGDRVLEGVTAFVEGGAKEKVLILLVNALNDNGLEDDEVSQIIDGLVRHQDERVPLMWAWTYGDRMTYERRGRSEILLETLNKAVDRLGMEGSPTEALTGKGGR